MAGKRSNIVAGVKASNQAAPQQPNTYGASGSTGISPLLAQYQQWTIGQGGSPYDPLPRDAAQFLLGQFGPLSPIQPMPIDEPGPGTERPEPRRFQYPVAWNMPHSPPGTEGLKLIDFTTLRTYADAYSVARAAIQVRKSEIRGLEWDIHPTKEAEKKMRGDQKAHQDFARRRDEAIKFFKRPDPDYQNFSSWIDALLEDIFVVDALSLYLHPTRLPGKGLLGSSLAALELIDGTTIRPLLNLQGGKPLPPSPAYQQYLQGIPRVDLLTLLSGDDVKDLDAPVQEYRGDQLLYLPYTSRSWTPYGFSPIERAIVPIITGMRKQQYQLDFFDEGTIPGVFVSPGENSGWTPNQIKELQDALNAIAGDPAWKHKAIALPPGSRVDPQRQAELADMFDEIVMTQVCMALDVMPMELGISPRTSTSQSGGAANQMAKTSEDTQERKATKPLLLWLKQAIFDPILQDVCGQRDMAWTWEGLEEGEDEETKTNLIVNQMSHALLSIDEGRAELGKTPWGLPETSDPGILTATGFTPLGQWNPLTEQPGQQPGEPAQQAPPGSAGAPGAPGGGQPPQPPHITTIGPGNKPPAPPPPPGAQAAGQAQSKAKTATKSVDVEGLRKAAASEVDALNRHLNKGRDPLSWQCKHIDPAWLAEIDRALKAGYQPDEFMGYVADTIDKTWNVQYDESKHPRGPGGKWTSGSGNTGFLGDSQAGRIAVNYSGHAPKKGPKGKKPKKKKGKKKTGNSIHGLTPAQLRAQQRQLEAEMKRLREQEKLANTPPPRPNDTIAWEMYDDWYNTGGSKFDVSELFKAGVPHTADTPSDEAIVERGREYWRTHVAWGRPGDFEECVRGVMEHAGMSREHAQGYCNLRHHEVTGEYAGPSAHGGHHKGQFAELVKVGPKGYIHGWIFVGAPGVGDRVFHPQHGHGKVTAHTEGKETHVAFESGESGKFKHSHRPGQARDFAKDEGPKVLTGEDAYNHMPKFRGSYVVDDERYKDKPFFGKRVYTYGGEHENEKRAIDYHSFDEKGLIDALSGYAANGYEKVNEDLRSGKRKKNKWLDEAFNRAPATEHPMLTHRGVEKASDLFGPVGSKIGQTFNDKAYVSTSASRVVADQFRADEFTKVANKDSAIINMHLPAGIKALSPIGKTKREQEILLNRDSHFKVVGDKVIDGVRTVDLELIP